MNEVEKAGAITVIIVWLLRIFLGPELNFVLLVATTLLSVYYLWFGFFIFNKIQPPDLLRKKVREHITPFRLVASILMGLVISYALIGVLFGFFFYTGMQFMLASSVLLLGLLAGATITWHFIRKTSTGLGLRFYLRAGVLMLFLLLLWAPPLEKRLKVLYRQNPGFIEAYLDYRANPHDQEALEKLREERSHFR